MIRTNLLKAKMVENGLTQRSLARDMGISKNTMNLKINGISPFTVDELQKMCALLGLESPEEKCAIFLPKSSQI